MSTFLKAGISEPTYRHPVTFTAYTLLVGIIRKCIKI